MRVDAQHDGAVGQVHLVAGIDPLREFRNGRRDPLGITLDRRCSESELVADREFDLVGRERPAAHLGSGQVDEHADHSIE